MGSGGAQNRAGTCEQCEYITHAARIYKMTLSIAVRLQSRFRLFSLP